MRKLKRSFLLVMLAFTLFWRLPSLTFAEGQCAAGPTITETIEEDFCWIECELPNPCDCEFPVLITYPGSEEAVIAPGESLSIRLCGGVPPFTWSVTGEDGWTLDHYETDTSYNILRLSLWTDCELHGATATVTVTDSCGMRDWIMIRIPEFSESYVDCRGGCPPNYYNFGDGWVKLIYIGSNDCWTADDCLSAECGFGIPCGEIEVGKCPLGPLNLVRCITGMHPGQPESGKTLWDYDAYTYEEVEVCYCK